MHGPSERTICGEVTVDAPVSDVWEAWTTREGVASFFAPDCRIELEVGGAYEMYFIPDAEPGQRGGEGGKWDEAFDYFKRAWLEVVLPRLVRRFAG